MESLFAENHEPFFNTIDPQETLRRACDLRSAISTVDSMRLEM
jgi:hypothetical protein